MTKLALEIIYLDLSTRGKASDFTSAVYGVTIYRNKTIELRDEFFIHPSPLSAEDYQLRLGRLAGVIDDDFAGEDTMSLQNE